MKKVSSKLDPKASVSLTSVIRRRAKKLRPMAALAAAGFSGSDPAAVQKGDLVDVLVEASSTKKVTDAVEPEAGESIKVLAGGIISARVRVDTADALVKNANVERVQTKKKAVPFLDAAAVDVGLRVPPAAGRAVAETGKDVFVAVVDSGFDLSHPMFRDSAGKLRVAALLDQTDRDAVTNAPRELDTAALEAQWGPGGGRAGRDADGHGTHVASTAAGSAFAGLEGVAPEAKFLLVKTDFINTDDAVAWAFAKAGAKPCVANLSLGHHWGPHDGTDVEERLHEALSGPGKIVVAAAGNEREDNIHVGGNFVADQDETVTLDLLRQPGPNPAPPFAAVTLWYSNADAFDVFLVTPTGEEVAAPNVGNVDQYSLSVVDIELARKAYNWSNLIQVQVTLSAATASAPNSLINGWGLRLVCRTATVGRIDGWVHNSGFAEFRDHPLVEQARTIGLPATGRACIAVASHATKTTWTADGGTLSDGGAVVGRTSSFSSMGPTRDGRWKPEISAPGHWVTAALADGSGSAGDDRFADTAGRLLTIRGTSMACPVTAGVIALLLQKKKTLTPDQIRDVLKASARHDAHNGPAEWSPAYGFGKIDVAAALAQV